MTFFEQLQRSLYETRLFRRGGRYLVAVSGGTDSMVLLHLLNRLRHDLGIEIMAGHFDHALRRSSAGDRMFVRETAASWGIAFTDAVNRKAPPQGVSVEQFARDRRYMFFARACRKHKLDGVVLAHHKNDLAETVLLRVFRGSGLAGLESMRPARTMKGVLYLRPFLDIPRQLLCAYARENRVRFITDPSNRDLSYERNRLRLVVIPFIERNFSRAILPSLASLAGSAGIDYDFIEQAARRSFDRTVRRAAKGLVIDLSLFNRLHRSVRRMVLRKSVETVKGHLRGFSLDYIQRAEHYISDGLDGSTVRLPCGLSLRKKHGSLFIKR
jgi:tRNA(Ile)-lysidine synthase